MMRRSTTFGKSASPSVPGAWLRLSRRMLFSFLLTAAVPTVVAMSAEAAAAAQANLSWSVPDTRTDGTPLTDLAGYKVYVGTASGSYGGGIDVGFGTSYQLGNLSDASTYYIAVTSYDSAGVESPFSNEVEVSFAAGGPYSIADALSTLRHATGLTPIPADRTARYDVAPLGADGKPQPNGTIDVADAMIILKNAVGLLSW